MSVTDLAALVSSIPTHTDAWLASLHPNMAGVDSIALFCVAVISLLGSRAIAGRNYNP
jgi:hypothetical protein